MARDDDESFAPRKSASVQHAVGEPLDAFSIEELIERVTLLHEEIARIETILARKRASREAAALFFKSDAT